MKVKVAELEGAKLDYWVAASEGKVVYVHGDHCYLKASYRNYMENPCGDYSPSTDWSQGGPIIERERIYSGFHERGFGPIYFENMWIAHCKNGSHFLGETLLLAAMRAFVASKFGEEVEG